MPRFGGAAPSDATELDAPVADPPRAADHAVSYRKTWLPRIGDRPGRTPRGSLVRPTTPSAPSAGSSFRPADANSAVLDASARAE